VQYIRIQSHFTHRACMNKKNIIFYRKGPISSISTTISLGVFIVILLFISCKSEAGELTNEQHIISRNSYPYLKKTKLPFETLSTKTHIGKAVKAMDKVVLSYELDIANAHHSSIFISKIEVVNYENEKVIAAFDSTYLLFHLLRPGVRSFDDVLEIKTSAFGIANLWLELDTTEIPKRFFHRISFKQKDEQGNFEETNIDLSLADFPEQTELKIGLPFNQGKWFYVANAHRDARLITEGKPTFPQRYAIDWSALTDQNKFESDSSKNIKSFYTYGQDLLAVSDAKIAFVKDSIPENNPFSNRLTVQITRETVGGNYVVLDIGNGIYAFYGHLIPGSLTVEVGDQVKKGEVIGKLGNSGNSRGPHLHFHLETKSKYPLGGEGVPYVFDAFIQSASYRDEEIGSILSFSNKSLPLNNRSVPRTKQLPMGNGIIEF